jgi:hypothetical protein
MTLETKRKGQAILLIRYSPHHSLNIFCVQLSLVVLVVCLFAGFLLSIVGLIVVIFLVFSIVFTFKDRKIWCAIDRETGIINYKKHGVLNSKYDTQNAQYHLTDIIALEMERYAIRGRDLFQIRLVLDGCTLPLSFIINFYECQSCASQIQQFFGDLPLNVID